MAFLGEIGIVAARLRSCAGRGPRRRVPGEPRRCSARRLSAASKSAAASWRAAKIVQHVSAIDVGRDHFRIALDRLGEVLDGEFRLPVVLVHVAGEERNVGLLGEDIHVLLREREQIVPFLQVKQVVAEVDNHVAILGQGLDGLLRDIRGLPIVSLEAEVALLLAQHLGFVEHVVRDAAGPHVCGFQIVRFDAGVHSAGHDQGVLRRQRIAFFIGGLRLPEFALRRCRDRPGQGRERTARDRPARGAGSISRRPGRGRRRAMHNRAK